MSVKIYELNGLDLKEIDWETALINGNTNEEKEIDTIEGLISDSSELYNF
jgi:hypothetical protein